MENSLFQNLNSDIPLAELMRPDKIEDFVGQENVIGENSLLRKMIVTNQLSSFILWGPPGSGKTTIANIISKLFGYHFKSFSAVVSGIKEVKAVMEEADAILLSTGVKTIVFVDEIHRFNKAQQDAFLPYVERGTIILIGATTANPSFSIISPLLSRMRVFILKALTNDDLSVLFDRALAKIKEKYDLNVTIDNREAIFNISSGDARRCYGILEQAIKLANNDTTDVVITNEIIQKVLMGRLPSYDKKDDYHYDYISALHKSMRNSDVSAAIYYCMKMLESGEDPLYILRRVIRFSSEDIGLADSNALTISVAAMNAFEKIGMPEGNLAILQAVVYNTLAPKSNALDKAAMLSRKDIETYPDLYIPLTIRNAPTKLMKESGYGDGYKYAHDYSIPVTYMQCMPDELKDREYYFPTDFGFEKALKERMKKIKEIKDSLKETKD